MSPSCKVICHRTVQSNQEEETHGVVRVEDVRGGGVVQDEGFVEVSPQAAQIFHVASLVEDAGLPEEPSPEHAELIQQVCDGVCVLMAERGGGKQGGVCRERLMKHFLFYCW